jgi:hypothetical protein
VIEQIKTKFAQTGVSTEISLLKGGSFIAKLTDGGISVDNLGTQPFLPWVVFEQAMNVMERNSGIAVRGNAMNFRLGDPKLPLDSIEGHIASVVYGRECGDTVFRRITPIACILIWAGICEPKPGRLAIVRPD